MQETQIGVTGLAARTLSRKSASAFEIVFVFVFGMSVILCGGEAFGNSPVAYIGSIWAANVLMLAIVYVGLRLRGQTWSHFGLRFRVASWRSVIRVLILSFTVFVAATAAFVIGAILMANLMGMPEGADMSRYTYLQGNLRLTLLALLSVYIVSALAEEVIYRGFLITRISEMMSGGKAARCFAVLVSSLVFGMVHSDWGIVGMVQASFMGLALGVSYLVIRRNLCVTILAHGYMDTILVLQMYFA